MKDKDAISKARSEQIEVATQYYNLIAQGFTSETSEDVRRLRGKLNELEEIIGDYPELIELLKQEREANSQ